MKVISQNEKDWGITDIGCILSLEKASSRTIPTLLPRLMKLLNLEYDKNFECHLMKKVEKNTSIGYRQMLSDAWLGIVSNFFILWMHNFRCLPFSINYSTYWCCTKNGHADFFVFIRTIIAFFLLWYILFCAQIIHHSSGICINYETQFSLQDFL